MNLPSPPKGHYVHDWLAGLPWEAVEALNQSLCASAKAAFGRNSDGYDKAKSLWEEARAKGPIHYADLIELCELIHHTAPFLFMNGNTLATIARRYANELPLGDAAKAVVRQSAGHIVAGVMTQTESTTFLDRLRHPPSQRLKR